MYNSPYRNGKERAPTSGGRPAASSNAGMMRGQRPEVYSAGMAKVADLDAGELMKIAAQNILEASYINKGFIAALLLEKEAEAAPTPAGAMDPEPVAGGAPPPAEVPTAAPPPPESVAAQAPPQDPEVAQQQTQQVQDFVGSLRAGVEGGQQKTADAANIRPMRQYVLFTPDGKVVMRRIENRRFTLPVAGKGRPAPYEPKIRFIPSTGVPEEGVHGYEVELGIGDADEIPEGFEAVDPEEALKEMYASMGLAENRQYRELDRARARTILRAMKKRRAVQ